MNDVLFTRIASASAVFVIWHFLTLLLCGTGLVLERVMRNGNPYVRSSLLRLTLLVAVTIPVICSIWNKLPATLPVRTQFVDVKIESTPAPQKLSRFVATNWDRVAVWRPMIADMGRFQARVGTNVGSGLRYMQVFCLTILGISSLISLYLLTRLVLAAFSCANLLQTGKPLSEPEEARCRLIALALGAQMPQLLKVKGLEGPVLLGLFKPAILFPDRIESRDEIYGHELTHLKRHDIWWHLFARIMTIFMPLQPGFWLLKNALERADEDVCDDMVLMQGANRSAYAELLLNLAQSQYLPSPDLCLPMAAFRSKLEHRLRRLMDTARPLAARITISSLILCLSPLLVVGILTVAIYLDANRPLRAVEAKPTDTLTAQEAKSQGIAAVVNQHTIPWVTVEQKGAETEKVLKATSSGEDLNRKLADIRQKVLKTLIDRQLIIDDFISLGGTAPEEYANNLIDEVIKSQYGGDKNAFLNKLTGQHTTLEKYKVEIEGDAMVAYMRERNVNVKLQNYYQDHLDLFPQDEQLNVTFITIWGDDNLTSDHQNPKYILAERVLDQVRKGADFLTLAKKYNTGFDLAPTRWVTSDGPMWVTVYDSSIAWQAIEKLQPGQTSDIIESSDGTRFYMIARLNQRRPARIASTEATANEKKTLFSNEMKKLSEEWLERLRANAHIQTFAQ